MKIKTAVKDYLIEIEIRKYTPRTLKTYRIKLGIFERFCAEELEIFEVDELTLGVVKQFTQVMMQKGKKGTYINGCLKTIKSFIQYCYDEDYGGFNTKRGGFKWVKEERPVIQAFSKRDVKLMLDNCRGADYLAIRDTAILTLLFETGIRCLELCMIKRKDIHEDYIVIQGKNHKQRVVPITPVLKKALMRVSPHTCRHFFAQQQLKMGVDLYTISRLLGHENINITQIYLNSLKDSDVIKIAKQNSVLMNM